MVELLSVDVAGAESTELSAGSTEGAEGTGRIGDVRVVSGLFIVRSNAWETYETAASETWNRMVQFIPLLISLSGRRIKRSDGSVTLDRITYAEPIPISGLRQSATTRDRVAPCALWQVEQYASLKGNCHLEDDTNNE